QLEREAWWVPLAGQRTDGAADAHLAVQAPGACDELAGQSCARGALVVRVELVESHGRRVLVDAPAAQLGGDPPAGEPSFGVPGAHDGLRVRRVVDQADLTEPVQDLVRDVLGVAFARQRLLELAAGLLRGRQDPQDDLASLLDGLVPADLAGLEAL